MGAMKVALLLFLSLFIALPSYAALSSTIEWEFRTTGDNDNGGGFTDIYSTTDYSQQDAAQLSITDGANTTGSNTLTSATGGFTTQMRGNVIYLKSGTNADVGWYQIISYTNTNTVALDRAPDDGVGNLSGGVIAVGGARALPTDTFFEQLADGNKVWFEAGTYTLTENINLANDGIAADPIVLEGYNTTRGDEPTGTNRPLIAASTYLWSFDNYWWHKHFRVTTSAASGLKVDTNALIYNVYVDQTGVSSAEAMTIGALSNVIYSEAEGGNGVTFRDGLVYGNYFHDALTNCFAFSGGNSATVAFNVFDTCSSIGLNMDIRDYRSVYNNVFYNNGTGYNQEAGSYGNIIINNIFDANTTGLEADSASGERSTNVLDYNVWDNTADIAGGYLTKGDNAVTGDPGLTDPANGDFTIGSGSNAIDAGWKVSTEQGLTGTYKLNVGVDQDDVAAGGGGGGGGSFTFVH